MLLGVSHRFDVVEGEKHIVFVGVNGGVEGFSCVCFVVGVDSVVVCVWGGIGGGGVGTMGGGGEVVLLGGALRRRVKLKRLRNNCCIFAIFCLRFTGVGVVVGRSNPNG